MHLPESFYPLDSHRRPRTDAPAERVKSSVARLIDGEKFVVCRRNGSQEVIVQSDRNPDRAQHSVDCLNEHEELNARDPVYYWRARRNDE